MATSVNGAFSEFLLNSVNLDPNQVSAARASHRWLLGQIQSMPTRHSDFPELYTEVDIHYGSFSRNTKIRELDDVDLIVGIKALGTTYLDLGDSVSLTVPDGLRLTELCHDGSNQLNSRKVINRFVKYLGEVPQYRKAEAGRNGAAAVLNLLSYPWSFDIVPGFFTSPELDGRTYYLIPDGNGQWMKTDPRLDKLRIDRINQNCGGRIRNPMRLIKYWNRRPTMPSAPSYLIECICLNHFESSGNASQYPDIGFQALLAHIAHEVLYNVEDPKRIQGNINLLTQEERVKIANRAQVDYAKAVTASKSETDGNHREAIRLWGEIFGSAFPLYG